MVAGIDREALHFSVYCADRLVVHLRPAMGDKILDVITLAPGIGNGGFAGGWPDRVY